MAAALTGDSMDGDGRWRLIRGVAASAHRATRVQPRGSNQLPFSTSSNIIFLFIYIYIIYSFLLIFISVINQLDFIVG